MRKLLYILLLCIATMASGQFLSTQQKPMLGFQVNWAHPLSKGLVGYWLFNEGSGNIVDDLSGNSNTGTLTGDVSWVSGKYGPAVKIGDSEDRIICLGAAKKFNATAGTLVFSFTPTWNYDDGNKDHYLFDTYGGNNKRFLIYNRRVTDDLQLLTDSSSRGELIYPIQAGVTYHFALVWGSNLLYINGVLEKDYNDGGLGTGADDFYIGDRYTSADKSISSDLHYFYVYNYPLSVSEIALLYREPFCMFEEDNIALMAIEAPAPTGQVIIINTAVPLFFLIFALVCYRGSRKFNARLHS